jgi:hypothetical protein
MTGTTQINSVAMARKRRRMILPGICAALVGFGRERG